MKVMSKGDINELLDAHLSSSALIAALELGLFWRLADGPQSMVAISQAMNIPPRRCSYWLRVLAGMNFLVQDGDMFGLSPVARTAILDAHSQETWKMLAIDARDNAKSSLLLAQRLTNGGPEQDTREEDRHGFPRYVREMQADLERARLFAQMLFELHSPLAHDVADALELNGAGNLLDVGGGSGVVSLALLRMYPDLSAVVVDIPNVCTAGQEIADRTPERDRISYFPADFVRDELPQGFDVVLECDVGQFDNLLLAKLAASLNEGGRLVIVDRWFDMGENETPGRLAYLLAESLRDPDFSLRSLEEIQDGLEEAGLEPEPIVDLPYRKWKMIRARKPVSRGASYVKYA
jgi:SAM-dependent methyltransferase